MNTRKIIDKYIHKWLQPLGLLWWEVTVIYYDNPKEIKHKFRRPKDGIVTAKVNADWKYGTAVISINLPAFKGIKKWKIERIIVHELVHILVNEMREGGIDHEERVVTGLTKAFFWTSKL